MKITRDEVEKLLAKMYRLEATEVELDIDFFDEFTVDSIDFDIWKMGQYFMTVLTIEKER
jgi:hypothetical protein